MLKFAVGSALLVTATHSVALSLGGTQGSVIIGRPLDILVQSSMDAEDAASGLCLEAEVLYGDARVPASAITAAIHRAGSDGALRVRVSQPVNEPIVTVILKAGCQQNFKRSYSLLADFEPLPPPVSALQVDRPAQVAAQPVRPQTVPAARPVPAASASGGAGVSQARGSAPVPAPLQEETPIRLSAPAARPAGVVSFKAKSRPAAVPVAAGDAAGKVVQSAPAVAEPAAPGGARLKLDPVEVAPSQIGAVLQSGSPDAAQAGSAQPAAGTGDVSGTGADANVAADTAVKQELQTLREEQERLRLSMETMNAQLAQARQDRYNNPVVYGLGALAAILLGGFLWLLKGRRRAETATADATAAAPWWTVSVPASESVLPTMPREEIEKSLEQAPGANPKLPSEDQGGMEGIEVEEAGASRFHEVPIAKVDIGVLLDLWQQVDFFESIGQQVDAAQALEAFVQANPRASEAPYLRWMQLAAQLGIPGMFDRAQAIYEHHYQRLIPGNVTSGGAGLGLEDDTGFALRLTQAWPGDEARAMVEQALVSQPGDAAAGLQVRSVQAFDDLMTLRGLWDVLQTQAAEREAEPAPMPFQVSGWATLDQVDAEVKSAPVEAPAAVTPAAAEPKPDLAPLDFDFLDFDQPKKKDGEGAPKA